MSNSSLHPTVPVLADIAIPTSGKTTGFLFDASKIGGFRGEYIAVHPAWSKSNAHGAAGNKHGLYGGRALYSTKVLALKALRHEIETRFAAQLHAIDNVIAEAEVRY